MLSGFTNISIEDITEPTLVSEYLMATSLYWSAFPLVGQNTWHLQFKARDIYFDSWFPRFQSIVWLAPKQKYHDRGKWKEKTVHFLVAATRKYWKEPERKYLQSIIKSRLCDCLPPSRSHHRVSHSIIHQWVNPWRELAPHTPILSQESLDLVKLLTKSNQHRVHINR